MKFEVNTTMDRKTMTAMAKAARKVMRRKRSLFVRVFGGVAAAMAVFLGLARFGGGDVNGWIDIALGLVLLAFILLEDAMNGAFAVRQLGPDNTEVSTTFRPDGYVNVVSTAEGRWPYDKIQAVCETKDYFVLLLGVRQGQVYDKAGFVEGTAEEFRSFISEKTGKPIQYIK